MLQASLFHPTSAHEVNYGHLPHVQVPAHGLHADQLDPDHLMCGQGKVGFDVENRSVVDHGSAWLCKMASWPFLTSTTLVLANFESVVEEG